MWLLLSFFFFFCVCVFVCPPPSSHWLVQKLSIYLSNPISPLEFRLTTFVRPHMAIKKMVQQKSVSSSGNVSMFKSLNCVCRKPQKKLPQLKQKNAVAHAPKHTGPLHFHLLFFFFTLRHVTQTFSPECAHNFWSPWMIVLQERERLQTIAGITNSLCVWFWI